MPPSAKARPPMRTTRRVPKRSSNPGSAAGSSGTVGAAATGAGLTGAGSGGAIGSATVCGIGSGGGCGGALGASAAGAARGTAPAASAASIPASRVSIRRTRSRVPIAITSAMIATIGSASPARMTSQIRVSKAFAPRETGSSHYPTRRSERSAITSACRVAGPGVPAPPRGEIEPSTGWIRDPD